MGNNLDKNMQKIECNFKKIPYILVSKYENRDQFDLYEENN